MFRRSHRALSHIVSRREAEGSEVQFPRAERFSGFLLNLYQYDAFSRKTEAGASQAVIAATLAPQADTCWSCAAKQPQRVWRRLRGLAVCFMCSAQLACLCLALWSCVAAHLQLWLRLVARQVNCGNCVAVGQTEGVVCVAARVV